MSTTRPLDGIRVVEAATWVLGPFAALQLGDLGAEVVKVESPQGDPMRRFGRCHNGTGLVFANCNRNKRSVFLDLKSEAGAAAFGELLTDADVFISNWRPAVAGRLGYSADLVRSRYPRLVWIRVSGFGQDGPLADLPAFDGTLQARSGYASRASGPPMLANGYLADKVTATLAAQSALAALFERECTGAGRVVDVAMLDAMAYFDSPDVFAGHTREDETDPGVLRHLGAVRPVRTSDGWLFVSAASGRHLARAVSAVGHPEWVEELQAYEDIVDMASALYDKLDRVLPTASSAHWEAVFAAVDVPASAVFDVDAHLDDPQVRHNDIYRVGDDPVLGRVRRVRHAARFDGSVVTVDDLPVPPLPEDLGTG